MTASVNRNRVSDLDADGGDANRWSFAKSNNLPKNDADQQAFASIADIRGNREFVGGKADDL